MDRKELVKLLEDALKAKVTYVKHGGELNPCHIEIGGKEFYVYVKEATSAHFPNPDVYRAQLTGRDALLTIQNSTAMFVMLGYDKEHDVYATWNPYILKQRIGTKSPSMYTRKHFHEQVERTHSFMKQTLNKEMEVLVFPRSLVADYLMNVDNYFKDDEYVAVGSKRRPDANAAFRLFNEKQNIPEFARYLENSGERKDDISLYCIIISKLIRNGYFSTYRKIFLLYDCVEDYKLAIPQFLDLQDVIDFSKSVDDKCGIALEKYVAFLSGEKIAPEPTAAPCKYVNPHEEDNEFNWEQPYEDGSGKLTKITNPQVLKMLRPCLDTEYPAKLEAFNIIEDFYKGRYTAMTMADWNKLLNAINWAFVDAGGNDVPMANTAGENAPNVYGENVVTEKSRKRRKRQKLKITLENGNIICEPQAADTLVNFIKIVGCSRIMGLNIIFRSYNLVTSKWHPKYQNSMKPLGDGLYVNTNSSTEEKYRIVTDIAARLNLNVRVEIVE